MAILQRQGGLRHTLILTGDQSEHRVLMRNEAGETAGLTPSELAVLVRLLRVRHTSLTGFASVDHLTLHPLSIFRLRQRLEQLDLKNPVETGCASYRVHPSLNVSIHRSAREIPANMLAVAEREWLLDVLSAAAENDTVEITSADR